MTHETLKIVSLQGYDSGSFPNFAFELWGNREAVIATYNLLVNDVEITVDLQHYVKYDSEGKAEPDKSELGCNFRIGYTSEDCDKYLLRLEKRLQDEFTRLNMPVQVKNE